ncbi:MAG: hypothetical protein GEU28_00810, partial [Dehalococcoidia bacterium]|nr:hypothetical protein [Dehalococcoidia bacterium]
MKPLKPIGAFAGVLVALSFGVSAVLGGQGTAPEVTVVSEEAVNNFPNGIVWNIEYEADAPIERGVLRYRVEPFGITSTAGSECEAEACTAQLEYPGDLYLPPFTELTYFWEFEGEEGESAVTDEASFTYMDTRFDWQTIGEGNVLLHYHDNDEDEMRDLLSASDETIEYWSGLFEIGVEQI